MSIIEFICLSLKHWNLIWSLQLFEDLDLRFNLLKIRFMNQKFTKKNIHGPWSKLHDGVQIKPNSENKFY